MYVIVNYGTLQIISVRYMWPTVKLDIRPTHLTFGMLLHYLVKLKVQIFYRRIRKQIAFLIASDFVVHPQVLIFSVFKIASLSSY